MTALALWLLLASPTADAPPAVDTLAICPAELRGALEPWLEFRRKQGHRIQVIGREPTAAAMRQRVRGAAAGGSLKAIVVVGDAEGAHRALAAAPACSVPTHHVPSKVCVQFGSEEEIASDNPYADLDGDRLPDVAVGRLTCDTPQQLAVVVRKILDYEQSADFGPWRRQIHLVAGLGGFGAVTDGVVEAAAKSLITRGIPAGYATTMTYGSWQSPYCPDPRAFRQIVLRRLSEGSLFWVYMGHGQERAVDLVRVPGANYPILSVDDAAHWQSQHGAPIACFLSCYSGAFDGQHDCLAETMLESDGGPVAVLCGSRMTMPYAMSVLGAELLNQVFVVKAETLGQAVLAAKRRLAEPDAANSHRLALDAAARALYPAGTDLRAERLEHLELFNLLGDPLLRLPMPLEVPLEVEPTAVAGQRISVRGRSPLAGACTLELVVRRDRLTFQPPRRQRFELAELPSYSETYERANDPCLATVERPLEAGDFEMSLEVPKTAKGPCHVRLFVSGANQCALGSADLSVEALQSARGKTATPR